MLGIYLCARKHRLLDYDIVYNDIISYDGIDIVSDCRSVSLLPFDYIICTPPCNYYSRANYRRDISKIALETKDILPYMINKCILSGKPFLIENVLNDSLLPKADCFTYKFGNHIYYTNVLLCMVSKDLFVKQNKANVCRNKRDGNYNVDLIIRLFLEIINIPKK